MAAFNPLNEKHRTNLWRAMQHSQRELKWVRELTHRLVREYAGPDYGTERNQKQMLLNLMNQAVDAYTMALVANRPRVLVSSHNEQYWFFAKRFEMSLNKLLQEIRLEQTLRRAVIDAFFSVGIVKIHMADSGEVEIEPNVWMDPGISFASNVSIDRFVCDVTAPCPEKMLFATDWYRVPFDRLRETDAFIQKIVAKLKPSAREEHDEESLQQITSGNAVEEGELLPMVDLMDVWVPDTRSVWTFAMDGPGRFQSQHPPIGEVKWTGSELGPYHMLGFNDVPENVMPTPPASHLASASRYANNLMRKQVARARAQKDVNTYTSDGADDAKRVRQAADREWVNVRDVNSIGTHSTPGPDAGLQAMTSFLIDVFDRQGGNLQAILGLGPQSSTVGQEQLIHTAATKKVAAMQYRVGDFTRAIVKDLGRMHWDDVYHVMPAQYAFPGAEDYPLDASWTPDLREGDFHDYDIDIDVQSMPHKTPEARLQGLLGLFQQLYIPLSQVVSEQGGSVNMQQLTEIVSDLMDEPRLKQIIRFAGPSPLEPDSKQGRGGSPNTNRTYTRRSEAQNPGQMSPDAMVSAMTRPAQQPQGSM